MLDIEMVNYHITLEDGEFVCLICKHRHRPKLSLDGQLSDKDRKFCQQHYESCYDKLDLGLREFPVVHYRLDLYHSWEKNWNNGWLHHSSIGSDSAVPCYMPQALAQKFANQFMTEMKAEPVDDDSENMDEEGERMFYNKGRRTKIGYRITKHVEISKTQKVVEETLDL